MAIVFDLDGTLSIVGKRLEYLNLDPPDWDAFYNACDEDKLNEPVALTYKTFHHKFGYQEMYICTGRRESSREKTLGWLAYHRMPILKENLRMRKDGDKRHDVLVKPELINDILPDVKVVFEDRNSMVTMWRELGLCCFQVADGDF